MGTSSLLTMHIPSFVAEARYTRMDASPFTSHKTPAESTLVNAMDSMTLQHARRDRSDRPLAVDGDWIDIPLDTASRRNKLERFAAHLIDTGVLIGVTHEKTLFDLTIRTRHSSASSAYPDPTRSAARVVRQAVQADRCCRRYGGRPAGGRDRGTTTVAHECAAASEA